MDEVDGVKTNDGMPLLTPDEHVFLRAALVVRTFYPHLPEQPPGFDESILDRVSRTGFAAPLSALDLAEAEHAVKCCLGALHAHAAFSIDFYVVGSVPPEKSHDIEKHLMSLAALLAVDASGGDALRRQAEALRAKRAVAERDAFFASREAAGARPIELSTGELFVVAAALDEASRADPGTSAAGPLTATERLCDAVILPRHFTLRDMGKRPADLFGAPFAEWDMSYRVPLTSEEATRLVDIVTASIDALPGAWSGLLFRLLNQRFGGDEDLANALLEKLRAHAAHARETKARDTDTP
jgi:hypothetical protein